MVRKEQSHQFHVHLITEVRLLCDLFPDRPGGRALLPASCLGQARPRCCSAPRPARPPHCARRPRPPASRGRWQTGEAWLHGRARRQSQGRLRAGCRRSPRPRCTMRGVATDPWSVTVEGTSEGVRPNASISQTGKLRPQKWQGPHLAREKQPDLAFGSSDSLSCDLSVLVIAPAR